MFFDVYCLFHVICFVSATVPFNYLLLFSSYCIWVYNLHIEQDSRGGVMTPILQTYLDICKVHIEHYSRARVMTKALHIGTKTDSETTPDSETRDSETGSRIQKINVVFRNYFVGFRNYFVGFRNYSWYSTISWYSEIICTSSIQKLFRGFRELFRGIQKLLVVFRNCS
jgi:hypothetical protein